MRVIILADGHATRWESEIPKHLIPINGEPLLHRTVRLLEERGLADLWITTHNPNYHVEDVAIYAPENNIYKLDQFYACHPLWRHCPSTIIFLYGDVYFSEACIDSVIHTPCTDFLYFQRTKGSAITGKPWKEGFAMKIADRELFFKALDELRTQRAAGNIQDSNHQVQGYLEGLGMGEYRGIGPHGIEINDETDDFDFVTDIQRWTESVQKFNEGKISP